jgi:predicted kinase
MNIYFVIGLPASGKSTYIKNKFKNAKCFDLYDYQKDLTIITPNNVKESYMNCLKDIINEIKYCQDNNKDEDIILEHTMLRKIRRDVYLQAIKEVTNAPISIIVLKPTFDTLKQRMIERNIYINDNQIEEDMKVLEIPTKEEGYEKVTIVIS